MRASLLFLALSLTPLQALIISGPNGAGAGNTTQASLNGFVSGHSLPAFNFWGNQIQVSDSSGIYLGRNDNFGWVLTAAHVSPLAVNANVIIVAGTPYAVRDVVTIGSADLRLYRIGGNLGDAPLPSLPNILFATASPSVGTDLLDFGRGRRLEGTANNALNSDIAQVPGTNPNYYEWGSPTLLNWGTNETTVLPGWIGPPLANANFLVGPYNTNLFFSRFDDEGAGNYLGATEATFSVGDSGGAAFRLNGSNWELAGLNLYVDRDPTHVAQPGASAGFGDAAFYANLATYRGAILAAMVPEPSATLLLSGFGLLALTKRRRVL